MARRNGVGKMIAPPTLVSLTRTGETAVAIVSNVDPAHTCKIYGIQVLKDPNPAINLYGSRTGNGAVALAGLQMMAVGGVDIPEPIVFFAITQDGAGYSPPSIIAMPRTIKFAEVGVSGLSRPPARTTLDFTIAPLGNPLSQVIVGNQGGGSIDLQVFSGAGAHTLAGLSAYGLPLAITAFEFTPEGTLVVGGVAAEIGAVTIEAGAPIEENIIAHVLLTLASITTGNGYYQTVKQIERKKSAGLTKFVNFPAIDVLTGLTVKTETETQGYMENVISLSVAGWTDDHINPDQALSYLAADIEKALRVDQQRGGLAISTYIHEVSRDFNDPDQSPSGMIDLRVDISYRHKSDNPYQ